MNKYKCTYVRVHVFAHMCVCTNMSVRVHTYVNLSAGTLSRVGHRKQKILESGNAGTVDVFIFEDARVNFSIT